MQKNIFKTQNALECSAQLEFHLTKHELTSFSHLNLKTLSEQLNLLILAIFKIVAFQVLQIDWNNQEPH